MNLEKTIMKLKGRDLLSIKDLTKEEILSLIELTSIFKKLARIKIKEIDYLRGKKIVMIFQKHSTRTRSSFSVALHELGTYAYYFGWNELQLARGETIKDTALMLNRYFDGAILRVYSHADLEEFAKYFDGPVINALSDLEHPCQIISDFFTMYEKLGDLKKVKIAFLGDGANNVATSLILGSAILGINIAIASPKKYQPNFTTIQIAKAYAEKTGSNIEITENVNEAVKNADFIYTDTFVSMGMEKERELRLKEFTGYQVNSKIFEINPNAYFMHCAPWHIGEEVTEEVVYGKNSIVFDQAENRLHSSKAILVSLF